MKNILEELSKKPWNSPLQLVLGGVMIFLIGFLAGPYYGCGTGNFRIGQGAFQCVTGTPDMAAKILIVACIGLASLCWGRAMSLADQARALDRS